MTKLEPDRENGLTKVSAADSFQVRSVSQERFINQIGTVSETIMDEIRIGLAKVLSIDSE
jgi:mRNA interferase MazF